MLKCSFLFLSINFTVNKEFHQLCYIILCEFLKIVCCPNTSLCFMFILCVYSRLIYPTLVAFIISSITFPLGLGQFMAGEVSWIKSEGKKRHHFFRVTLISPLHQNVSYLDTDKLYRMSPKKLQSDFPHQ